MNGVYAPVEEGLRMLKQIAPSAQIRVSGQRPGPFPCTCRRAAARLSGRLRKHAARRGIRETYDAFRSLVGRGALSMPEAA